MALEGDMIVIILASRKRELCSRGRQYVPSKDVCYINIHENIIWDKRVVSVSLKDVQTHDNEEGKQTK